MKHVLRSFALLIAVGSIFHQVTLAQEAESKITTTLESAKFSSPFSLDFA